LKTSAGRQVEDAGLVGHPPTRAKPKDAKDETSRALAGRVRPMTGGQERYLEAIRKTRHRLRNRPAGSQDYLPSRPAIEALSKIRLTASWLVRPAVEAGEKLGFCRGDLAEKVNPYLRPL